ncbi:MAG: hypothetical protein ACFCAD_09955 [Pleurocapsa sp.]
MTSKKKFWKQWLLANVWWSILTTILLIAGFVMIGSWSAGLALSIHFCLFKYRTPLISKNSSLKYKFSDNFMAAGSFFTIMMGLIGYTMRGWLMTAIPCGLLSGWITGKKILKKAEQKLT